MEGADCFFDGGDIEGKCRSSAAAAVLWRGRRLAWWVFGFQLAARGGRVGEGRLFYEGLTGGTVTSFLAERYASVGLLLFLTFGAFALVGSGSGVLWQVVPK